jgi:hypothetical protein
MKLFNKKYFINNKMPEVDKQITFTAFHICMAALAINLVMNGNYDYIINFINYLINFENTGLWFVLLHILILYILLSNLEFELGFRAAIKFNI